MPRKGLKMAHLKYVRFASGSLDLVRRWFEAQDYTIEENRAVSRCRSKVWSFSGREAVRIV